MKTKLYMLLIFAVMLVCCGCNSTEGISNSEVNESSSLTDTVKCLEPEAEYIKAKKKIEEYNRDFIGFYSTDAMNNQHENIIVEEKYMTSVQSTEGNNLTVYKTKANEIIRACVTVYGESWNKTYNYYVLGNGQIYISILTNQYSSMVLTAGFNDVFSYTLNEYIFQDGNVFEINHVSEQLTKSNKEKTSIMIEEIEKLLQ